MPEQKLETELLTRRILHQLDWLQQQESPIYRVLPVQYLSCNAQEQWVEFEYLSSPSGQNPHGFLHGGVTAWLLDTTNAIVCRCFSGLSAAPSLDLHINYLKGIPMNRKLFLHIEVKRLGTHVVNLYDEIRDSQKGTLYVTSTANSYLPPNTPPLAE